ncbi:MAG: SagB/ThcOx family dehydrogenase [Candidatus Zixiibacteriota bacterium]
MKLFIANVVLVFWASTAVPADSLSIGQIFHRETSFNIDGVFNGKNIAWGKQIPPFKFYPEAKKIELPESSFSGLTVEEAIVRRKSDRSFTDRPLTTAELAQILLSADGITHTHISGAFSMRTAPSGGALYPIELYVIVNKVDSLENGLYHFQVSNNSLELLKSGDFSGQIHEAANNQDAVGKSPITVILTARFERSTIKYADRGYRYVYMEAGAICENIYLQATSLKLGTVAVGAFNDERLNNFLEIDGLNEAALLIMPVGHLD